MRAWVCVCVRVCVCVCACVYYTSITEGLMASGIYIACTADHTYVERRNPKLGLFWCFFANVGFRCRGRRISRFQPWCFGGFKKISRKWSPCTCNARIWQSATWSLKRQKIAGPKQRNIECSNTSGFWGLGCVLPHTVTVYNKAAIQGLMYRIYI